VEEFESVFSNQLTQGPQLYLLDILEDMKFLNHDEVDKNYQKIEQMLNHFGITLIIEMESDPHLTQVKQNLKSFLLAISNMN
jgi:hypothetical protein